MICISLFLFQHYTYCFHYICKFNQLRYILLCCSRGCMTAVAIMSLDWKGIVYICVAIFCARAPCIASCTCSMMTKAAALKEEMLHK